MSSCFRKEMEQRFTWKDKNSNCKKHDYSINYLLKIVNDNDRAFVNYLIRDSYHLVLKCTNCNSFIAVRFPHNVDGTIFERDLVKYKSLPLIIGHNSITDHTTAISEIDYIEFEDK